MHDYVHGKHLYINDLVSTESQRSRGIGSNILKLAESKAKELGGSTLRLCTGVENGEGKKFYERNEWVARAVVYKKTLS